MWADVLQWSFIKLLVYLLFFKKCMETENAFLTEEVEEEVDYEANVSGKVANFVLILMLKDN